MTTQDAIIHFGGVKQLAALLNIWPHTIRTWGKYPPMARQYELQVKTGGKLMAEEVEK